MELIQLIDHYMEQQNCKWEDFAALVTGSRDVDNFKLRILSGFFADPFFGTQRLRNLAAFLRLPLDTFVASSSSST